MKFNIREATLDDAEDINRIANWYIENTTINFDVGSWSLEKRREWVAEFIQADSPYHLLVGESNGIIGFACNTRFRPKAAYNRATETTVYIDHNIEPRGRGGVLYEALLARVKTSQFHRAYAVITLPNQASILLHERLGFTQVGAFDEIGHKFGAFHSVAIYEKSINHTICN